MSTASDLVAFAFVLMFALLIVLAAGFGFLAFALMAFTILLLLALRIVLATFGFLAFALMVLAFVFLFALLFLFAARFFFLTVIATVAA